jgi:hypothetical protein
MELQLASLQTGQFHLFDLSGNSSFVPTLRIQAVCHERTFWMGPKKLCGNDRFRGLSCSAKKLLQRK